MALGELLPDLPDRDNPGLVKAENCIPHVKSYKPARELVPETDAIGNRCRGATALANLSGAYFNYAGDIDKLYYDAGNTYDAVGGPYALSEMQNWEFASWDNDVYASSGAQTIQSGTMGGAMSDVTGAPDSAHMAVIRNFLVTGNTSANQSLVKWSAIGDPTDWTGSQSGEQVVRRGGPVRKVVGYEYGVVFCEFSIWRMNYVGSPAVWQFDEVEPGRGTRASRSVVQIGELIYYLDRDGWYVFDGATARPIASNRLNATFLADYDDSKPHLVCAAADLRENLIYWAYPSDNSDVANRLMVFNWVTNRWAGPSNIEVEEMVYTKTPATLSDPGTDCTTEPTQFQCQLSDNYNTLVDSPQYKGGSAYLAAFDNQHRRAAFTGPQLTALIESGEYSLNPGGRAKVLGLRPLVDGQEPTIEAQIGSREDVYGPVAWGEKYTPNAVTGKINVRNNARYHRYRIHASDFEHIYGAEPEYAEVGRK